MIEMLKCHERSPVEAGRKREAKMGDAKMGDAKMGDTKNSANDEMMTSDKRRNEIRGEEKKDCDSRKLCHSRRPQSSSRHLASRHLASHHLASPYHSSNLSVFLLVTTIIVTVCLSDQVTLGRSSSSSFASSLSSSFASPSHPSSAILDTSDSKWTPRGVSVIGHRKDVRMRGSHHYISPKKNPSPKGWIRHFIPWPSSLSSSMIRTPDSVSSNSLSAASPHHSSSSHSLPLAPSSSFSSSLSHDGHSSKGTIPQSHHATLDATKKMKEKKKGENETLPRATSFPLISPKDGIPEEQIPSVFWRRQSKVGDPINPMMMMISRTRRALRSSSSHESRLYDVPQIGK